VFSSVHVRFALVSLLIALGNLHAQQPLQMASLRPNLELHWQRVSPTVHQPDGPVLYQLLFNASGTPGTLARFDTNPRHLTNSLITDNGSMVAIGGLSISRAGLISFAGGQMFPAGSGDVSGSYPSLTVAGLQGHAVANTAPATGQVLQFNGTQWTPSTPAAGWLLGGNIVGCGTTTSPCLNFIGSTDNSAVEIHANGQRAFRIEPASSPTIIGGFVGNYASGHIGATIAGGGANSGLNGITGDFGTIGGGYNNGAGFLATVAGGFRNFATGGYATVAGGESNQASGDSSTVAGGVSNSACGLFSNVAGGSNNAALGTGAAVAGGFSNTAKGIDSTVAGGYSNTVAGIGSFAAGENTSDCTDNTCTTNFPGVFLWGDNTTANVLRASAANQFLVRAAGGMNFFTSADLLSGVSFPPSGGNLIVGSTAGVTEFTVDGSGNLNAVGDINTDATGANNGTVAHTVKFGGGGEAIGSKRTAGGNQYGLDFYTNSMQRMFIDLGGTVHVVGNLTKGGGSFQIDHPLDPANKYLSHSFVESPDMMNIYNGNVTLDAKGRAWIKLPDYFEALNQDFRYQLTPIGNPGQHILYIAKEIAANRFKIAGGKPGAKVSWQVTGIRHDAYANAHRIQVEEDKGQKRGTYLHPELFETRETAAAGGR
jgi:hypothetical protein